MNLFMTNENISGGQKASLSIFQVFTKHPMKNDINPPTATFGIYKSEISRSHIISPLPIYYSPIKHCRLLTISSRINMYFLFVFDRKIGIAYFEKLCLHLSFRIEFSRKEFHFCSFIQLHYAQYEYAHRAHIK